MALFAFLPFLIAAIYLAILGAIIYLIYTWVTKFIKLREEQNELLREIIQKMDHKP